MTIAQVGDLVDGKTHIKTMTKSSALSIPMIYCTRRLVLAISLVYLQDYFWIQIFIQILLVQTSLFVIQWYRPLNSRRLTRLETLNEVVTYIVLTFFLCFSDFISDLQLRYDLGFACIVTVSVFGLFHLVLLSAKLCQRLKLWVLRLKNRNCSKSQKIRPAPPVARL